MRKDAKRLVKHAESLGYVHVDTNCKGARRYEHPGGHSVLIQPGLSEDAARAVTRQMLSAVGAAVPEPAKRRPAAVRQRQAVERGRLQREAATHSAALERLAAERSRLLAGHGGNLNAGQVREIEALILRTERQRDRLSRLMTEIPAGAEHSGSARTARHRSGAA